MWNIQISNIIFIFKKYKFLLKIIYINEFYNLFTFETALFYFFLLEVHHINLKNKFIFKFVLLQKKEKYDYYNFDFRFSDR